MKTRIELNKWYVSEGIENGIWGIEYIKPLKQVNNNSFLCTVIDHTINAEGSNSFHIREKYMMFANYLKEYKEYVEHTGTDKKAQLIFDHLYKKIFK